MCDFAAKRVHLEVIGSSVPLRSTEHFRPVSFVSPLSRVLFCGPSPVAGFAWLLCWNAVYFGAIQVRPFRMGEIVLNEVEGLDSKGANVRTIHTKTGVGLKGLFWYELFTGGTPA